MEMTDLNLFSKVDCTLCYRGLERKLRWLENAWDFVIRWVARRELKQQYYFLSFFPNFTPKMVVLVDVEEF